jgi:acyl carrier protein phosphodiesterase
MNLLAHAWLSCPEFSDNQSITEQSQQMLIGGFVADFVKGNPAHPRHGLSAGVVAGIVRHRRVDAFTDAHPAVAAVRAWLHPRCHKYAGVAVDVFFDHFLARDFTALTGASLPDFVAFTYQTIRDHPAMLPPNAQRMADAMIRQDWLTNYQTRPGIDRTLKGLSQRTAHPSGLDTVIQDFEQYYDRIGIVFREFWGDLTADTYL